MGTLRVNNFDKLLDIYSEIKNLLKRCDYRLKSALGKISSKLCTLTNYQASNEGYCEYLNYAATRLNILHNSIFDKTIKTIISKIYNKIVAIMPEDFQLLLFAEDSAFCGDFKIDVAKSSMSGIHYIWNAFWDNLAKVFSRIKNSVKPAITAESEYIQLSLILM
jgi:hypothetical protein